MLCERGSAEAYSYESPISDGCHETITAEALRAVRARFPELSSKVDPTDEDRAMISSLPFSVDEDMNDLVGATLLIGVRDNDLKAGMASIPPSSREFTATKMVSASTV
ncbi:MAG: hypothetical protein HYV07_27250 [Deltaproteobacteria bacterium]|nr:hypothetical protein [Deltaproteobacteria bacterium]